MGRPWTVKNAKKKKWFCERKAAKSTSKIWTYSKTMQYSVMYQLKEHLLKLRNEISSK